MWKLKAEIPPTQPTYVWGVGVGLVGVGVGGTSLLPLILLLLLFLSSYLSSKFYSKSKFTFTFYTPTLYAIYDESREMFISVNCSNSNFSEVSP